jgi:hypothetical protein
MSALDELAEHQRRRDELQRDIRDAEVKTQFASSDLLQASAALAEAERRRIGGDATAQDVAKAEKRLAEARRAQAIDVSTERLQGMRAAVRDLDAAIGRFAQENYSALRNEHTEQAVAAAQAIDRAVAGLVQAFAHRQAVDAAGLALWSLVARPVPRLTAESGAQRIAAEAAALLDAGPDAPPVLPADFRPEQVVEEQPLIEAMSNTDDGW